MPSRLTTAQPSPSANLSQEQLGVLTEKLLDRLDDLFGTLGVDLMELGGRRYGPCPVHGGDNPSAFKLFTDGFSQRGNWLCHTWHCEEVFLPTLIGFVRGMLSAARGWTRPGDPTAHFRDAVTFCLQFLGTSPTELVVDPVEESRRRFVRQMDRVGRKVEQEVVGWSREQVRRWLDIPAQPYLARGYLPSTLDRYDVGVLRSNTDHPLAGRIAVPVYDDEYRKVVGLTGRSIHARCGRCSLFHAPEKGCPQDALERGRCSKWANTTTLHTGRHLYNFWFARPHIEETRSVILVEGPGDAWRVVEAGFENVVALFGTSLEDCQQITLEATPALDVVLLLDNDEAGAEATRRISRQLGRLYRLHAPRLDLAGKDVGDTPAAHLREQLAPILERLAR